MRPILFWSLILFCTRAESFAIIVNAQNPVSSLSKSEVSDFFMKKNKFWPDGMPVRFFDRTDASSERKSFLSTCVKKSVRDIEIYWIGQKLYSGHSAPTQVHTDSMTEIMVSKFPGAIGYVSEDYEITRPVKKIPLTGQ